MAKGLGALFASAGLVVAATVSLGVSSTVTATPARAVGDPTGCGYGTDGPNASTICWFDFTGYDQTAATSAAGQDKSVTLPGGYTMSFTLHTTMSAETTGTKSSVVPEYAPSLIGNTDYKGIPGEPALISGGANSTSTFALSNIVVKDPAGVTVTGYSLVSADAEATSSLESINWRSDTPISTLALLHPAAGEGAENGCQQNITGSGTTSLTCTGSESTTGTRYGSAVVQSVSPTTFSATLREGDNPGAEAIILGVMTANVTLDKTVASRVNASDSFDLATTSPEGTVQGSATTGTANTATTGSVTVLPRTADQPYTLSEAVTAGTEAVLGNYTQSWACTNSATDSTTALPAGAGTSKTLTPAPGDDITCTITNTAKAATLGIVKHAGAPVDVNGDGITDAGDTIAYTFAVTNTGAVTMSNIGVTDAKAGAVTCPDASLAVGASEICAADSPYTITAADVMNGSADNSATATGTAPGSTTPVISTPSTTTTPTTTPAPALTMVKTASPDNQSSYTVGQQITYSFAVTNTGNVPVSDVTINEGDFTGTGTLSDPSCPETTLAAGAEETCTATYTLTQADVDAGTLTNNATANGTPPTGDGTPPTTPTSTVTIPIPDNPAITVVKSASASSATAAGQEITYSFKVTNTGNTTLTDVTVNEGDFSGTGALSDVVCPEPDLPSGHAETCTATYTVTQADIDAGGSISNTATATGTPPNGDTPPVSPPSTSTVTVDQSPSMSVVKSASPSDAASYKVGEQVTYSFVVTNTGDVTLTDPTITDSDFSGTGTLSAIACPSDGATLAPGADEVCTATYTITQADVDAGKLTNTATVTGTTPGGDTTPPSDPSTVTVPGDPHPALTVAKTADVTNVTKAGQVVTYTFKVTDTGNTTITDPKITDSHFTGHGTLSAITCPSSADTLLPGQTVECTATYTVVAADLAGDGTLSNTATVTGELPDGGKLTSDPSTATVKEIDPVSPVVAVNTGGYTTAEMPLWERFLPFGGLMALLALSAGLLLWMRRKEDPQG